MKRFSIITVLLLTTLLASCGEDPFCNCLQSSGKISSEERAVEPFVTLEPFNNISVILHHSTNHFVRVNCPENLMDGIETDVENGVLRIRNNNRCNWMRNPGNEFVVDVYSPEVQNIICRTVGDIICRDTLRTRVFTAESWDGYGTIDLKLDCEETYLKIHTGPIDIIANGISQYTYLYNTGNGYIRANGLSSNDAFVMSRSTGDCYVNSRNSLKVKIEYQGDIYYSGQPTSIEQDISGSGKLIAY